jgi:hypothetical protein
VLRVCAAAAGDEPVLELWAHPESASAVMIADSTSTVRQVVTHPTVRGTADRAGWTVYGAEVELDRHKLNTPDQRLGRLLLGTVGQVHDAVVVGLGGDEGELEGKPVVEQAGSVTQRQRVHEEV